MRIVSEVVIGRRVVNSIRYSRIFACLFNSLFNASNAETFINVEIYSNPPTRMHSERIRTTITPDEDDRTAPNDETENTGGRNSAAGNCLLKIVSVHLIELLRKGRGHLSNSVLISSGQ